MSIAGRTYSGVFARLHLHLHGVTFCIVKVACNPRHIVAFVCVCVCVCVYV